MNERHQLENESKKRIHRPSQDQYHSTSLDGANGPSALTPRKDRHLTPLAVLGLQRTYGNRYVQRVIAVQRAASTAQIQRMMDPSVLDDDDGGFAGDTGFYGSSDQESGDFGGDAGFNGPSDQGGDFVGDTAFYGPSDQGTRDVSIDSSSPSINDDRGTDDNQVGAGDGAGDSSGSQNSDAVTDPNNGDTNSWQSEEGVAKQDISEAVMGLVDAGMAEAQAQKDLETAEKTGDSAATQAALQDMLQAMVNKMTAGENMSVAAGKLSQIQQNKGQWSAS